MYNQQFCDDSKKINDRLPTSFAPREKKGIKLKLINTLFDLFHKNSITYCHWKSNQHLDASMIADTDLDVLFDIQQKTNLENLLKEINFKKLVSVKEKKYHEIEDYIGLDFSSGKIIHLHAHFRLTMGEIYLKSYQLKIENRILNSRVYDEEFEIYRIHPAFELILLFYRQALKIRNRDKLSLYLKHNEDFRSNILKEYDWLKKRCTDDEIKVILKTLLPNSYQEIYELVTGKFNLVELIKLAKLLKKNYKNDRLYSPVKASTTRWYREIYIKVFRRYARFINQPLVLQRSNPRGGLSIAIIGADGSGKSTIINDLQLTFKKKFDVYKIYFGRGCGRVSWYRKILVSLKNLATSLKKSLKPNNGISQKKIKQSVFNKQNGINANVYNYIEGLMIAWERYSNLRKMQRAKKKGMLVICDRFPQNQVIAFNDGPTLQHLSQSKNPFLRMMARKEYRIYKLFEQETPDLIFKLIASARVIEARKPGETSIETLQQKIEWVQKITFPESCEVITVNAEDPLEKVMLTIKRKIWETYK
jgi:thymidylate kinase